MAVEWGRSCYESEWFLFRDAPAQSTRGRYYFAPEGTPFYPGRHHLSSRNWHDSNWRHEVVLGESLASEHVWDAGELPFVQLRTLPVGNADCLADGAKIANAIPGIDAIDGFLPACVLPTEAIERTWQEISSYDECATQRTHAFLVEALMNQDEAEIRRLILEWLGDVPSVQVFFQTPFFPGMIVVYTERWTALVIDGTRNFQQFALQAFSFVEGPTDFGDVATVPLWSAAQGYLAGLLGTIAGLDVSRLMCVGYSYGAACALLMAVRMKAADPAREIRYLTFGCPKIGNAAFLRRVRECEGVTLVNDDDIIPVMPPDRLTLLPALTFFALPILLVYTEWLRPPNAWLIDRSGNVKRSELPLLDSATLIALITLVLAQRDLPPIDGHFIQEYARRLGVGCPAACWPINEQVNEIITFPNNVLALQKPSPHKGKLLLSAGNHITPPNHSCATAMLLDLETDYVFPALPAGIYWYKVPVVNGQRYFCKVTTTGTWLGQVSASVACPPTNTIGFLDNGTFFAPCLSDFAPFDGFFFLVLNPIPNAFTLRFGAGFCP